MKTPFRENLKIVEFNVENLFLSLDYYQGQDIKSLTEDDWQKLHSGLIPMKPLAKVSLLGEHLSRISPHIILLCEVGGKVSIDHFNSLFLKNRYHSHIIEGNSERGIDLGYLIRKDLPVDTLLKTHKDRPISFTNLKGGKENTKFSRDVLELRIFDSQSRIPWMVFLGVHLKSKLDKEGLDPQGRIRRQAELQTVIKIYLELEEELAGKVPIILGGDFNGQAGQFLTDPEFADLYDKTLLQDALSIAKRPPEERVTHVYFHPSGLLEKMQLDYLFLSPQLHSRVVPEGTYVDYFQSPPSHPQSKEEQWRLPSDHYPVVLTLGTRIK